MARLIGKTVPLTPELVYGTLEEMEEAAAEEMPDALAINPHGYRAIDVAQEIQGRRYRGLRRVKERVTWREAERILEDLARDGAVFCCVPGRSVRYYRTVGG